jgi:hypothetical protein
MTAPSDNLEANDVRRYRVSQLRGDCARDQDRSARPDRRSARRPRLMMLWRRSRQEGGLQARPGRLRHCHDDVEPAAGNGHSLAVGPGELKNQILKPPVCHWRRFIVKTSVIRMNIVRTVCTNADSPKQANSNNRKARRAISQMIFGGKRSERTQLETAEANGGGRREIMLNVVHRQTLWWIRSDTAGESVTTSRTSGSSVSIAMRHSQVVGRDSDVMLLLVRQAAVQRLECARQATRASSSAIDHCLLCLV